MGVALGAILILMALVAPAGCGGDSSPTTPGNVRRPLNQQLDSADITFFFAEGDSVNADYQQAFHE